VDITYFKLLDIDAWFKNKPLNYETFLAVHKNIFGDLYEWVRAIRTIPICKEEAVLGGMSLNYGDVQSIQLQTETIIHELNQVGWTEISVEDTILLFSDLITRLWLIRLFREVNTRTVMWFADLFANAEGFPLNSKLLREHASYVRKSFVLYCVEEVPGKNVS
jgi:cell filamentation protein